MSVQTEYGKLFSIEMSHDYFTSGSVQGVQLVPTQETSRMLQRLRWFFKTHPSAPFVFAEKDDSGDALVKPETATAFHFLIREDVDFGLFTDLSGRSSAEQWLLYSNPPSRTMSLNCFPKQFVYSGQSDKSELTVKLIDRSRKECFSADVPVIGGNYQCMVNFQDMPEGVYAIRVFHGSSLESTEVIFLSDELHRTRGLGIVEIRLAAAHDYSSESEYTVEFGARQAPWTYRVELTQSFSGYSMTVEDEESHDDPGDKWFFLETTGEANLEEGAVLKFQSSQSADNYVEREIPFSDTPKKDLKLKITHADKPGIIKELPSLSYKNLNNEINIYI